MLMAAFVESPGAPAPAPATTPGPIILAVDDSEPIRSAVTQAFAPFRCTVHTAADGQAGLALATELLPAAILLDCSMPVMDGLEMLARLKSNPRTRPIPVVMLTANSGKETALRVARLGAVALLPKPFDGSQVVQCLAKIVPLLPKSADTQSVAATESAATRTPPTT